MSTKKIVGFSKSEIYRMYPGVPKSVLRQYMNEIIRENRNMNDDSIVYVNTLLPKEFDSLKDIVGEPVKE